MKWYIKVNGKKQAEEYLNRLYALGCHWRNDDEYARNIAPEWFSNLTNYLIISKDKELTTSENYLPKGYVCTNIEKLEQELKNENTTRK